jgi:hypothetical protein
MTLQSDFAVDVVVASEQLRFNLSSHKVSSEIRHPVFGVRAMDELTNKTVVQPVCVEFYISNTGSWNMYYIKLLTTVCNGSVTSSRYGRNSNFEIQFISTASIKG